MFVYIIVMLIIIHTLLCVIIAIKIGDIKVIIINVTKRIFWKLPVRS